MSNAEVQRPQPVDFPSPTFDQAVLASQRLWAVYGIVDLYGSLDIGTEEPQGHLDDRDAAKRLEDLAEGVMRGEVTSHRDIVRGIKGIAPKIGPLGGIAMEIDLASFKLFHAIGQKFNDLTDIEIFQPKQPQSD